MSGMPRFFLDFDGGGHAAITGADARHIAGALRMRPGEELSLCNGRGDDFACVIESASMDRVELKVLYKAPTASEPTLRVTLYQGLPKGDKLEWIIQKAVELGVVGDRAGCHPAERGAGRRQRGEKAAAVATDRRRGCRAERPGDPPRRQRPSPLPRGAGAAREGKHPRVLRGWRRAPAGAGQPDMRELSILVGPEGGFEKEEVEAVLAAGGRAATLGKRILRCETAPVAALSALMLLSGNME